MVEDIKNYDPWNNYVGSNYNPHKHKKITRGIFDNYIRYPQCFYCKIQLEPTPPPCISTCKMYVHSSYIGSKIDNENINGDLGIPYVECKYSLDDPLSLYTIRTCLVLNWFMGFDFIFRTRRSGGETTNDILGNDLELCHKDGDHFNDRFENIAVWNRKKSDDTNVLTHSFIDSRISKIKINLIELELRVLKAKGHEKIRYEDYLKEKEKLQTELFSLMNTPHSPDLWKCISELIKKGII